MQFHCLLASTIPVENQLSMLLLFLWSSAFYFPLWLLVIPCLCFFFFLFWWWPGWMFAFFILLHFVFCCFCRNSCICRLVYCITFRKKKCFCPIHNASLISQVILDKHFNLSPFFLCSFLCFFIFFSFSLNHFTISFDFVPRNQQ